jgi:hypothetical protein
MEEELTIRAVPRLSGAILWAVYRGETRLPGAIFQDRDSAQRYADKKRGEQVDPG